MVEHPTMNYAVMNGGYSWGGLRTDIWVLDMNTMTWTRVFNSALGRWFHAMVYDSVRDNFVIHGTD